MAQPLSPSSVLCRRRDWPGDGGVRPFARRPFWSLAKPHRRGFFFARWPPDGRRRSTPLPDGGWGRGAGFPGRGSRGNSSRPRHIRPVPSASPPSPVGTRRSPLTKWSVSVTKWGEEEGEQRGRVRRASGEGGRKARRQGCLGRRFSPGTWPFPDLCPPRAPLAPCFHPPETLQSRRRPGGPRPRPGPWRRPGRNGRGGSPAGSRSRSWRAWRREKVRRRPRPPARPPDPGAGPPERAGGVRKEASTLHRGSGLGARGGGSQARPGGRRASCEAAHLPSRWYPTARPWLSPSTTDWGGVQGVQP